MIIIDEENGYFVFIKARGKGILLQGPKKTNKHTYQVIRLVGREISTVIWIARVF